MTASVFAVPVFFVVFRETVETVIIISILLAFLKQTLDGPQRDVATYKKLVRQVWAGAALGLLLCFIIGAAIIAVFYTKGKDAWNKAEYYWEGSFALVAAIIIGVLGAVLLRVSKLQDKWRVKLAVALEAQPATSGGRRFSWKRYAEKYCMFYVPFITVMREGLEGIVFIAGVTFSSPVTAVPLAVVMGLLAGAVVGYLLYKGGASSKLQIFLVASTCLLYLVGAGLFSRSVWYFEAQDWNNKVGSDAAELGAGAGSYDISHSVWHVNFGNPELNGGGGWGIFSGILGWTNSATYGSVISYNLYWICVIAGFILMRFKEVQGYWPPPFSWLPRFDGKAQAEEKRRKTHDSTSPSSSIFRKGEEKKVVAEETVVPARTLTE